LHGKIDALIDTLNRPKSTAPEREERGLMAGRFMRAVCAGKGDPEKAARFAKKEWGDSEVTKALEASDAAAGGVLVPPGWSSDLIELLRERGWKVMGTQFSRTTAKEAQQKGLNVFCGDADVIQPVFTRGPGVTRCDIDLFNIRGLSGFPGQRVFTSATAYNE